MSVTQSKKLKISSKMSSTDLLCALSVLVGPNTAPQMRPLAAETLKKEKLLRRCAAQQRKARFGIAQSPRSAKGAAFNKSAGVRRRA